MIKMTLKNEIKKAKEREEAKERKCKTVKYKGFTFNWYVMPLAVLFYHLGLLEAKIESFLNKTLFAWNEEKAKKIIDKTFPKIADCEDGKLWYYSGWGATIWANTIKPIHFINREWAYRNKYKLQEYMINDYEPEGFEVCVEKEKWGNEYWIIFKEI
jgi:hypothetical protein